MSARYDEAVEALRIARVVASGGYAVPPDVAAGQELARAQALGLLAIAEEVEALVELLRDRLVSVTSFHAELVERGPCGHVVGDQCRGCDHATHHGSACLAAVIAASGGEELCRCRFDEETSTQAPERCGHRPEDGPGLACTLDDLHPSAVLHADDHGNAWT